MVTVAQKMDVVGKLRIERKVATLTAQCTYPKDSDLRQAFFNHACLSVCSRIITDHSNGKGDFSALSRSDLEEALYDAGLAVEY